MKNIIQSLSEPENAAMVSIFVPGELVMAAGLTFTVLHTPGHTAGSVCYQIGDKLFTGDTLFRFGCGRTDLPTGSSEQMQASLARVVPMARNLEIYPGHGD